MKSVTKFFLTAGLLIFLVQLLAGIAIYFVFDTWSNRGTFGDMFGAVNALFSGLAFGGVIYAIFLQRDELALQRKELELTRSELSRQADATQAHAEHLKKEAYKAELMKNIEKAERDFFDVVSDSKLSISSLDNRLNRDVSVKDVLFDLSLSQPEGIIPKADQLGRESSDVSKASIFDRDAMVISIFVMAAAALNRLCEYVDGYEEFSKSKAISEYYRLKFQLPIRRFRDCGYPIKGFSENA